jgi:hypothetical protein
MNQDFERFLSVFRCVEFIKVFKIFSLSFYIVRTWGIKKCLNWKILVESQ